MEPSEGYDGSSEVVISTGSGELCMEDVGTSVMCELTLDASASGHLLICFFTRKREEIWYGK